MVALATPTSTLWQASKSEGDVFVDPLTSLHCRLETVINKSFHDRPRPNLEAHACGRGLPSDTHRLVNRTVLMRKSVFKQAAGSESLCFLLRTQADAFFPNTERASV